MNYLDLVNEVLVRLRETEVSSVNDNAYSKLIGKFVNDAKRTVEDAYGWNALEDTITVSTVAGTSNYVLTGSGQRFKVIDVLNDTSNTELTNVPMHWMNKQFILDTVQNSAPVYYTFSGVDSNGDNKVDLFPVPDSVYSIDFNLTIPQTPLSSDSTTLKIPSEPVIFLAYAKALAERGEDGGMASSEAYGLYRQSLADAIAIESGRYIEDETWGAV